MNTIFEQMGGRYIQYGDYLWQPFKKDLEYDLKFY